VSIFSRLCVSGIAGGALDDRAARRERAARLGILDDRERSTVLHAGAGIGEFAFAEDVAARFGTGAGKPDERRIADEGERIGGNRHRARR
jgi:hypothetical protein